VYAATVSEAIVEFVSNVCFLLCHEIGALFINTTTPDLDFLVS
jgi:hypothetical protein